MREGYSLDRVGEHVGFFVDWYVVRWGDVGALKLYSMQIVLCSANCASNVMEGFF